MVCKQLRWSTSCVFPAMMRHVAFGTVLIATASLLACAHLGLSTKGPSKKHVVTAEVRRAAIRRAHIWAPTNVRAMDLEAGPNGPGAFTAHQSVSCDYLNKKMSGQSPKFACVIPPDDELKVKYGRN